tara:strand:- start:3075 stop:3326 length:252 start_codon:yes stop_codon:yes gene_type:complete
MSNISHVNNLYDEMLVIRDQLLNRIEILEDEVEYLTQENMFYSKHLYQLEQDIDTIVAKVSQVKINESQKSSKEIIEEGKETP